MVYGALATVAVVVLAFLFGVGGDETTTNAVMPADTTRRNFYASHAQKDGVGESRGAYSHWPRNNYHAGATLDTQPAMPSQLFTFDPNTADSTQLLRLGLQRWQVNNIYRYRARGGVFQRKEDFARVYGLTQGQYRRLEPYINIAPDYRPASELVNDNSRKPAVERDTLRYPRKLKVGETIVLNTADTTLLKRVPGVGSYYANRVVQYGKRLGGYASVSQLLEIKGFPQDALPYFRIENAQVKRINLNKATVSQMQQHPYINFYQARAITDYRRLHGPLKSLNDLSLHPDFPPEAITRLLPYVEF